MVDTLISRLLSLLPADALFRVPRQRAPGPHLCNSTQYRSPEKYLSAQAYAVTFLARLTSGIVLLGWLIHCSCGTCDRGTYYALLSLLKLFCLRFNWPFW
jgi:hypothetical protein